MPLCLGIIFSIVWQIRTKFSEMHIPVLIRLHLKCRYLEFVKISIKIGRREEGMSWNMMVFCLVHGIYAFFVFLCEDRCCKRKFRELGGNPAGYWKLPSGAWSHRWWATYEKNLTKFVLIAFELWVLKTINTADYSGLQTTSLCMTPRWIAKGM